MAVQQGTKLRRGIHHDQPLNYANMGRTERTLSVIIGGGLALFGVVRGGVSGLLLALLGGGFIAQGASGVNPIYKAIGTNRAVATNERAVAVPHKQGIRAEKSITIDAPMQELYRFWRNFENLPRIMDNLVSVTVGDNDIHSHWVVKAPAGVTLEWDAEIHNEVPGETIGWRSVEGAPVPNAGAVRFRPAPGGRGTEVHVKMEYMPPAGQLGAAVASLFGDEPNQTMGQGLRNFKQLMEAGEIATNDGQPRGPYLP